MAYRGWPTPRELCDRQGDIAADRPDAFACACGDFLDRQGRFVFMTESQALH